MSRYFTADPHLFHDKVAKIRFPESNVPGADMLRVFLDSVAHLHRGDQLWILGDLTVGHSRDEAMALDHLESILDSLGKDRPTLHLISGNHDTVSSIHKDGWKSQEKFRRVFSSIQDFAKMRMDGTDVLLSHFPYQSLGDGPERTTSRYNEFRLADTGFPLIHGHTHQPMKHSPTRVRIWDEWEVGPIDRKQFCVSWDAHRGLVHEKVLVEWIKTIKELELI